MLFLYYLVTLLLVTLYCMYDDSVLIMIMIINAKEREIILCHFFIFFMIFY